MDVDALQFTSLSAVLGSWSMKFQVCPVNLGL